MDFVPQLNSTYSYWILPISICLMKKFHEVTLCRTRGFIVRVQINILWFGKTIHYSFFTMQFFPPSQKFTIPNHNITKKREIFFPKTETKPFLLIWLERISIRMCHVLWKQFFVLACTLKLGGKDHRNYLRSKNFTSLICLWKQWYTDWIFHALLVYSSPRSVPYLGSFLLVRPVGQQRR